MDEPASDAAQGKVELLLRPFELRKSIASALTEPSGLERPLRVRPGRPSGRESNADSEKLQGFRRLGAHNRLWISISCEVVQEVIGFFTGSRSPSGEHMPRADIIICFASVCSVSAR